PVHQTKAPEYQADYLRNPPPRYPRLSRRMKEQGEVLLRVEVGPEGRPRQIELHRSSGHPRLDRAARQAVEQWRFVPARRGESAVSAWVVVPIAFSLGG
ncbi:MAG: energy transducer TonB, partial [Pseudomonadota bacterium]